MLVDKGNEVVGVFLQVSQNYNLDYSGSDIDTKAILLPSFEDFLLNKKLVSTTIELEPTKEHVDIKDIRLMFQNFKKQNINFIEILFTDYFYINPKYKDSFKLVFDAREKIARDDMYKALNSMAGMSMEKFKAMEHPYPTIKHKIDKFGYDGKQAHHIERLNNFIKKFINNKPYSECMNIESEIRQHLIDVKTNDKYSLEEARIIAKSTCDETYVIAKEWQSKNERYIDEDIDEILTQALVEIFKIRFKEELQ